MVGVVGVVVQLAVDVGRLERGHRVGEVVVVVVVVVVGEGLEKELGRSCHTALKVRRRGQRKGKGWCWCWCWDWDSSQMLLCQTEILTKKKFVCHLQREGNPLFKKEPQIFFEFSR